MAGLIVVLLAALFVAAPAFAQQVAALKDAEGNVLVSRGDALVAAGSGERLAVGMRVVTTAGAKATISYDNGCEVRLKENERFTVKTDTCAALLASVEALGAGAIGGTAGATAAASAAGGFGGFSAAAITAFSITGGIVALGVIEETRKNNNVSPH